jgi:tryptophan-rich sensory protein
MNIGAIVATILPFIGGFLGKNIVKNNIASWYVHLRKPSWTPSSLAIRTIWSVIYACMGYASYLVYNEGGNPMALVLYGVQLLLTWSVSPVFFGLHNLKLAAYQGCVLWVAVASCGIQFYSINQMAGLLFVPYQAWITFATFLSFQIWGLNGDKPEFGKK